MWATVTRANERQWADDDDDYVDYCSEWQLAVRYAIADLRSQQLVAEVQIELADRDGNSNSQLDASAAQFFRLLRN